MAWTIVVVEPVRSWLHDLRRSDRETLLQISAAVTALSEEGSRAWEASRRHGSRVDARQPEGAETGLAGSSEIRLLFVFDPVRQAVLLVGGDKSGDWRGWYRSAIPIAESAYADHLQRLQEKDGK